MLPSDGQRHRPVGDVSWHWCRGSRHSCPARPSGRRERNVHSRRGPAREARAVGPGGVLIPREDSPGESLPVTPGANLSDTRTGRVRPVGAPAVGAWRKPVGHADRSGAPGSGSPPSAPCANLSDTWTGQAWLRPAGPSGAFAPCRAGSAWKPFVGPVRQLRSSGMGRRGAPGWPAPGWTTPQMPGTRRLQPVGKWQTSGVRSPNHLHTASIWQCTPFVRVTSRPRRSRPPRWELASAHPPAWGWTGDVRGPSPCTRRFEQ